MAKFDVSSLAPRPRQAKAFTLETIGGETFELVVRRLLPGQVLSIPGYVDDLVRQLSESPLKTSVTVNGLASTDILHVSDSAARVVVTLQIAQAVDDDDDAYSDEEFIRMMVDESLTAGLMSAYYWVMGFDESEDDEPKNPETGATPILSDSALKTSD